MRIAAVAAFCLSACASGAGATPGADAPSLTIEPYEFAARDGRTVEAELGRFAVPENRADPDARMIELAFVRFASTADEPGAPIVYLAGGPGGSGSGTAQGARFDIFMALREEADVIAFDQRGTGLSQELPDCAAEAPFGADSPLTREALVAYARTETARCLDWWRAQGIDIAAYNTRESAADIDDLRRALGVEEIDLWAISYGTHLGAAYLRDYEAHAGRAVFAGYEGPDDTVKLPSRTDAMLGRLADVIAADPAAREVYPDLIAMMSRVHARLAAEPVEVAIADGAGGDTATLTLGAFPLQIMAGFMLSDPASAAQLPALYLAMDHGQFEPAAAIIHSRFLPYMGSMGAMATAMDLASGVSPERLARVEREAESAVLGDALNFPMPHLLGVAPDMDLGDEFRAPLAADTPILFISGTLDGRTSPEAAREAMAHLPNARQLVVENGGHNIYEADPRMIDIVRGWFAEGAAPEALEFAPPSFLIPG